VASGSVTIGGEVFHAPPGAALSPRRKRLKRALGFVTQDDILFDNLTVRESLDYTAALKLPGSATARVRSPPRGWLGGNSRPHGSA